MALEGILVKADLVAYVVDIVATISGRDFVTPDDIKTMAYPVLEHRLILRPEYEIEGLTIKEVIENILKEIAVPR
jgi:MoxR-like ATPase